MITEYCTGCNQALLSFAPRAKTDTLFVFDYPGYKEIQANSMMMSEAGRAVMREISIAKFSPQEYNLTCFIGHLPSKGKGSRVITTDPCWAASVQRLVTICKMYKHIMFMGNDMVRALWEGYHAEDWYGLNMTNPMFPDVVTLMCIPSLRELTSATVGEFRLGLEKFRKNIIQSA